MNLLSGTYFYILAFFFFFFFSAGAQEETEQIKAQIAFGVNSPSQDGFVENFVAKEVNFPTINLGVQYMFNREFGAKLDFGYNRFSNENNSPEFKTNYSRINLQGVYDATYLMGFLPERLGVTAHAGPGFTFIKPLGSYPQNKVSYFNALAGLEIHYYISSKFSVYADTSYIFGFGKDFDPVEEGYGSFNGNLLNFTVGVSVSLSGCRTCN